MFNLVNIKNRIKSQGGFSLAEVVMALLLFSATLIGISGLVLTGGADITRGANDSVAANLANKKLEEVRGLPFYKAWEGRNQDIDDFYYNMTKANGEQLDNPGKVEDYGSIPGASNYRRTSAIQYQVVSGSSMVTAEMAYNWVPKPESGDLQPDQIDRPTNSYGDAIHAMVIEVAVYYRVDSRANPMGGEERVYRQRTLAGDMIIPGGSSVPVLLVTAVDPTTGSQTEDNLMVTVTVNAQESILGGTFDVRLWSSGSPEIVGTGTTVVNQYQIRTYFDLTEANLGPYNISVKWVENGWVDKSFRNCFTVVGTPPTITNVGDHTWGCRDMSSRQVTVTGTHLANPTYVGLLGPNEGGTGYPATDPDSVSCPGSIVSSSDTEVVVNFNLTKVPEDCLNTRWTVEVATAGGSAQSDTGDRLLVNPIPQVTSVTCTPSTFYRKLNYTEPIVVRGKYFQPGSVPTVTLKKTACEDITGGYATGGSVTEDDMSGTTHFTMGALDLRLWEQIGEVVIDRPIQPGNGANEVGDWNLYVTNQDGQESTETDILVPVAHAPIRITGVTSVCYNDWDAPVTITGDYFQPDDMSARFYDDYGLTGDITVTGDYGAGQTLGGLVMNTISLTNTEYGGTQGMTVTDTENGQTSPVFAYTVALPAANAVNVMPPGTEAPDGCTWPQQNAFWNDSTVTGHDIDTVAEPNVCYDDGTYTYRVIAKKMRNSNVVWAFSSNPGTLRKFTITGALYMDRQNKYVLAQGSITWRDYTEDRERDVMCSNNGGTTWGPLYPTRIRVADKP